MKDGLFDRAFKIILIFTVIAFLFLVYLTSESRAYYEQEEDPVIVAIFEKMDKLIECESDGYVDALNPGDQVDGSDSVGILQFGSQTWEWANSYYETDLDMDNPEHQKIIGYKMIEEERFTHWTNCSLKEGFI